MKNYYLNYKNREEKEYRIDSIISKWYLKKCDFSVFNQKEYCLIQTKHNHSLDRLKRILFRNVLIVSMFLFACLIPCACTNREEMDAANELINQFATEQTTNTETTHDINVPMDTDKPEDTKTEETTPAEPVTPVEEKQEDINPRDMKAVYGLDYDVPIYTEEEIEQAKSNLTSNYDDYIVKDWTEECYNIDQKKEMAQDYYVANQDLFCQLNDMVSEFDGVACYNSGTRSGDYKIYYDETNDIYLKLDKDSLIFYNKKFEYTKQLGFNNFVVDIGDIAKNGWMQVGPGSYAIIATIGSYEYGYTDKEIEYSDFGCDFKELEEYGFKPQKLNSEAVVIEDESYSLELK